MKVQKTKTPILEAAHYGSGENTEETKRTFVEVVAESSAFVVMDHFGFDSGQYAFTYTAGWRNGDK